MTDGHTAGFMVAGHHDQGILGMLCIEVEGNADGVIEIQGIANGGHGVVSMTSPVDLATFDHDEEAIVTAIAISPAVVFSLVAFLARGVAFVKIGNGHFGHLGQGEVGVGAVDGVGHGRGILKPGVDADHFLHGGLFKGQNGFAVVENGITIAFKRFRIHFFSPPPPKNSYSLSANRMSMSA